jgi:hypothetical protein
MFAKSAFSLTLFFFCITAFAQNLSFSFADVNLDRSDSTLSFAVMVSATSPGTYHTGGNCYLNYSTASFGNNAFAAGRVSIRPALTALTPASYALNVQDVFAGTTLNIDWSNFSIIFGFPIGYVEVPTTPDTLVYVSMKYIDPQEDLHVSFDSANTDGKTIWFDNLSLGSIAAYNSPHSYGPDIFFPGIVAVDTQRIQLQEGWNLISSYLDQPTTDMDSIFQEIAAAVWIVKDDTGNAYIPGLVNTLGPWQQQKGYWLKAYQDTLLTLYGQPLTPARRELNLPLGWSLIAYLRDSALNIPAALGTSVLGNLYALKDQQGGIYLPAFGIDQIGSMQPGQGYWINMNNPDTLRYPARQGFQQVTPLVVQPKPFHFPQPEAGMESATLVFPAVDWQSLLQPGDEIAVFGAERQLVGSGVYMGENMALTIWGDEAETAAREGLLPGEKMKLIRWDGQSETSLPLKELSYQAHAIEVVKPALSQVSLAGARLFPNPASSRLGISLPPGETGPLRLELYNSLGQQVVAKSLSPQESLTLNVEDLPRGVYPYRLIAEGKVWRGKVELK